SILQVLHGCCERAVKAAVIPGSGLEWAQHYAKRVESDRFCLNEWEAMNDLESVHTALETRIGFDMRPYKEYIDNEILGSEWNAANFEELQKNKLVFVLACKCPHISVCLHDSGQLFHDVKSGEAVLVHCKMGVSRSASTVIAYAMKQQRWSLEEALAYVRDRRSIVKPNDGFLKQLQTYSGILNARWDLMLCEMPCSIKRSADRNVSLCLDFWND
ncbi:hypothetical protein XENOCAPTIV_019411, partial [Xenoophorus captivus]